MQTTQQIKSDLTKLRNNIQTLQTEYSEKLHLYRRAARTISLNQIKKEIDRIFSLGDSDLRSKKRNREFVVPRYCFIKAAVADGHNFSEVGRFLGLDHSTVMHHAERTEGEAKSNWPGYEKKIKICFERFDIEVLGQGNFHHSNHLPMTQFHDNLLDFAIHACKVYDINVCEIFQNPKKGKAAKCFAAFCILATEKEFDPEDIAEFSGQKLAFVEKLTAEDCKQAKAITEKTAEILEDYKNNYLK